MTPTATSRSLPTPVVTQTFAAVRCNNTTASLPLLVSTQRSPGKQPFKNATTSLPQSSFAQIEQTLQNVADFCPQILVPSKPVTHQSPELSCLTAMMLFLVSPQS